ncbi:MAG: uracil phosphoribosyltransferase [Campylobacterota bacterium]|nr:uracil phosphoribosyltransferase [Campylobacterota bacterium]
MIHELNNPITKTLITILRDKNSNAITFRHTINELTKQLIYEALKDISMIKKTITTWQGEKSFNTIDESKLIVVTVLRAGLPMIESVTDTLPNITAGFLAMKRDEETHKSVLYYDRVPACEGKTALIVDPMLATGGSMCDAIDVMIEKNVSKIVLLNIIGSPEGVKILQDKYPNIDIHIAQIDQHLNENKFIIPGLGDAGDRSYNTPE